MAPAYIMGVNESNQQQINSQAMLKDIFWVVVLITASLLGFCNDEVKPRTKKHFIIKIDSNVHPLPFDSTPDFGDVPLFADSAMNKQNEEASKHK